MAQPEILQDARRYLAVLHKRRAILATTLGVSLLAAVLYNYTTRPLYVATSQILIAPAQNSPKVLPNEVAGTGQQDYQTEYELLRSRRLAEKVVEKLGLQHHQELTTGPLMSPWERFQRSVLRRAPATTVDADGIPLSPAAAAVRSRLTVEPLPGGRLVNIRFSAYDPSVAAQLANTLAQAYVEQSLEFRFRASSEATAWLTDQLKDLQAKVESAQKALLEHEARRGGGGASDDKRETLSNAALSARMERIAKETTLQQIRSLRPLQQATFPAISGAPGIIAARNHLAELQSQQIRMSETLGDRHPDMVKLRADIRAAEMKLQQEVQGAVRVLESDLQAARAQESTLQANVAAANRASLEGDRQAIDYETLKRDLETNQQLYQALLSRNKEAGLETELKSTNVRITEKAEVPRAPAFPRRTRNYQIALLAGLGLGIALAFLFENVDNTVKTPDDIKELAIPFLGMVPQVAGNEPGTSRTRPDGPLADAYRVVRTNLIFSSAETGGRAIVVSSANPGEGKTTTAANVATALALNGAKVLVVDADLRRPTIHQQFGLPRMPGLSDLLVGRAQASESIKTTRHKGLFVMPCGYTSPNPAELLGSGSMREVVAALRSHYDWVVIDTPPILAMADTPVLCPFVDGVVLVMRAEETSRAAIQRAVEQIAAVGGKLVGAVLNGVDLRRNSYYYSHYYGEYYRSYYSATGARNPRAPRTRAFDR